MNLERKKIKNYEFININEGLKRLDGILSVDLGMIRGKLTRISGEHIEDMQSYTKTEEWLRINRMIDAINVKYSEKKPDGTPLILDGRYAFKPDLLGERDAEFELLKKKEKNAFEQRRKLDDQYNKMLRESTEIDIPLIPISLIKQIESEYKDRGEKSPFVNEIFDYLNAVIDENS